MVSASQWPAWLRVAMAVGRSWIEQRPAARGRPPLARQPQHARPAMLTLLAEFNETFNLAVKDGVSAVYVEQVESARRARMRARIGDVHPLHSTALGEAILAFVPDGELAHYLAQPLIERSGVP